MMGTPRPTGGAGPSRILLLLAAVALVVGVATRQADPIDGFSPGGALAGLASQLPTTLPAAILVAIAMLLDLAAGAVLLRLLRQAPFATWSDFLLGGFVGAVLLDALLLFTLGGAGMFRQQTLALVLGAMVVAGLRCPPAGCTAVPAGPGTPRPLATDRPRLVGAASSLAGLPGPPLRG